MSAGLGSSLHMGVHVGTDWRAECNVYADRTRFIPKSLLGLFERVSWPAAELTVATPGPAQPPRIDVAERLRGMWRVG